jgi:hypothetical protein
VSDATTITPNQPPAEKRRIKLSDVMIIIVGIALALAMAVHFLKYSIEDLIQVCRVLVASADVRGDWPELRRIIRDPLQRSLLYGFHFTSAVQTCMIPIFFIVRLRRPRPRWRTLVSQPGVVAVLAMVFGGLWVTGWVHILLPGRIDSLRGPWIVVGSTVAVAWLILVLVRKWHAERCWVDRFGRFLGTLAIATAFLAWIEYRI